MFFKLFCQSIVLSEYFFNMTQKSFQDYYPDHLSHCYGCGRLNEFGLQIKSYWDGEESVCTIQPKPYHIAIPGHVYGGFIASIIDCHCIGMAAAATYRAEEREMDTELKKAKSDLRSGICQV